MGLGPGPTVCDLPRQVGPVHALKSPGPLAARPPYQGGRGRCGSQRERVPGPLRLSIRPSRASSRAPPATSQRLGRERPRVWPASSGWGGSAAGLSRGVPCRAKLRRPAWPPAVVRGDAANRGAQPTFKKPTHPQTNSPPLPSESPPPPQKLCLHLRMGGGGKSTPGRPGGGPSGLLSTPLSPGPHLQGPA